MGKRGPKPKYRGRTLRCKWCNEPFITKWRNHKFCSNECKWLANPPPSCERTRQTPEHIARRMGAHIGAKRSKETRERISVANFRGKKIRSICLICGDNYETYNKGTKYCSMECMWRAHSGEGNPNWKGGRSEEAHLARTNVDYQVWRILVFERDNYTCRNCGDGKGGNLCAHHIKTFRDYPELRYIVSNGMTLCNECHEGVHYA